MKPTRTLSLLAALVGLIAMSSCAPTVNVATPEPVKIDVNMNVNVTSPPMPERTQEAGVAERRRSRMGEVQELKNARVIGEDRDGYLQIVNRPSDPAYLSYAERLMREENADRTKLYLDAAKQKGQPLEIVEQNYARQWAERAYPGELIQNAKGEWQPK